MSELETLLYVVVGIALGVVFSPRFVGWGMWVKTFLLSIPDRFIVIDLLIEAIRYRYRLLTLKNVSSGGMEFYLRSVYWRLYDSYDEGRMNFTESTAHKRRMDATAALMAHLGLKPDEEEETTAREQNLADAMKEMGHWDRFYWEG